MSVPDRIWVDWSPVDDLAPPSAVLAYTQSSRADASYHRATFLHTDGPTLQAVREANDAIGMWLSAALEDEGVCAEMKADINRWFAALKLMEG